MTYIIILLILLTAWCPWVSATDASQIVDDAVAKMEAVYPNLCVVTINKDSLQKVPFGYTEEVSYDCTKKDSDFGVLKDSDIVFVTPYKGTFGLNPRTQNVSK